MKKITKKICGACLCLLATLPLTGCFGRLNEDDVIELINEQNIKYDFENARNLYKLASTNFNLNIDNNRDNLIVELQMDDERGFIYLYRNSDNEYNYLFETKEGAKYSIEEMIYEKNDKVYLYENDTLENVTSNYSSLEAWLFTSGNMTFLSLPLLMENFDILKVEILENGNYEITFRYELYADEEETYEPESNPESNGDILLPEGPGVINPILSLSDVVSLIKVEISKDAKLAKMDITSVQTNSTSNEYSSSKTTMKFTYGKINSDYIKGKILEING